jgi:hypothetical protein
VDEVTSPGRLGRALGLLYLTMCIIALAVMLAHSIPEDRRTAARLRVLRLCALVTSRLARRAGVASMGRELATGEQSYHVPYGLARLADQLGRAYRSEAAS